MRKKVPFILVLIYDIEDKITVSEMVYVETIRDNHVKMHY